MNNEIAVRSKGVHTLLVADLIFSILAGLTIVFLTSFVYDSVILTKIADKLLFPLMIIAPILMICNIIAVKKSDNRTRSKLIGYIMITAICTFLSILGLIAAMSFFGGY